MSKQVSSSEKFIDDDPYDKQLLDQIPKSIPELVCCICYDNTNDKDRKKEKMFTQCGHYFHKSCYARANRNKINVKCVYCQTLCPNVCENQYYDLNQVRSLSQSHCNILENILLLMNELKIRNFVISGSFAVHLYQTLHQHHPEWIYNDIDIYTESGLLLSKFGQIAQTKNFVLLNDCYDTENNSSSSAVLSDIIMAGAKYNIYSKTKKNKTDIDLKHILTLDFIETSNNNPEKIISSFDLDCCKIAITIEGNIIKFHIHNDYYVDSYSVKNSSNKTFSRVKKYRNRGFKCLNLDMCIEN
jgi:hypothetical protein